MKTAYYPYDCDSNKFVEITINCLRKNKIEVYDFKEVFKNIKNIRNIKIFNFNWYENVEKNNKINTLITFTYRILIIKILKILNKKIIWNLHNKKQHDIDSKISNYMMKFMAKNADKIIILCEESNIILREIINKDISHKVKLIPHPNYIGCYPVKDKKYSEKLNIEKDNLKILFIGAIKPYKNVEMIIKIANRYKNEKIKFIIAGKTISDEYEKELVQLMESKNIIALFEFINDDSVADLISLCDVLIFPYDLNSSLNSGSIILAFSNKKTVISPNIGTLKDINNNDLFFSYDYENENEHEQKIIEIINDIYKMKDNVKVLNNMGKMCYEFIEDNYSQDNISKYYKQVYEELDNLTK